MRISERFGIEQEFYCVGDSLSKDLSPAKALGMNTIWAKYGTYVDPANLATLLEVTPWTSDQVAHESVRTIDPDYVAKTPRDIARILNIPIQGDLFMPSD
jgi:phosphoglycolate phosphatase